MAKRCSKATVEHREVETREVVTVGAGDLLWGDPLALAPTRLGALVRLIPPADATDERIGAVRAVLLAAGAASVKVMPRLAAAEAVAGEVASADDAGAAPTTGDLREAVTAELAAARGLIDPAAVAARVEEALGAAGL